MFVHCTVISHFLTCPGGNKAGSVKAAEGEWGGLMVNRSQRSIVVTVGACSLGPFVIGPYRSFYTPGIDSGLPGYTESCSDKAL